MSVWSSLHTLRWRLRARRFRNRPSLPAVLLYHSIGERLRDPLHLAITPAHFEDQLRWLAAATTPLPLEEFVDRMGDETLPANATTVTFDDGYADNFLTAEPLLRRIGVPGTVFLATAFLDSWEEPWWEALDAILLESNALPGSFTWGTLKISVEPQPDLARSRWTVLEPTVTRREEAFLRVSEFAKHLSPGDRTDLLHTLSTWAGAPRGGRSDRRMASWSEVRSATRHGVLSLGGHTRAHSCLAQLSPEAQRREISTGLDDVERETCLRPGAFAYPFGTYHDFTPTTRAAARHCGLGSAFANMVGPISSRTDRWQIPRLLVGKWSATELARRLGQ